MMVVCCVCQKIKKGELWVEGAVPDNELPSHGYCPECAAAARAELALLKQAREAACREVA